MLPYNKKLVSNARTLRKNMTPEEKKLWYEFLKLLPFTVKRQHNIENFIVDFYIASKKLVIEIDGDQHGFLEQLQKDKKREEELSNWGINVIRYTNNDIRTNFDGVVEDLLRKLQLNFSDLKIKK